MHWFVVPPLDGPPTGGTLFNRHLIAALAGEGLGCVTVAWADAGTLRTRLAVGDSVWVDSLYLAEVSALARMLGGAMRVGLVLHYLPALVRKGGPIERAELSAAERQALECAACFLVTSTFMRDQVLRLVDRSRPVLYVEPGRPPRGLGQVPGPPVRGIMVANLVPGKGIAEFLCALADQVDEGDDFTLAIVGGASDPEYAQGCRRRGADPRLGDRVHFRGARSAGETRAELAASNLLVSASTMESYGMALAEARSLGVPILARPGGHVESLVGEPWGGELAVDAVALARAFVRLCRNPDQHRRRLERARAQRLPPRSWSTAAREFVRQVRRLDGLAPAAVSDRAREGRPGCR